MKTEARLTGEERETVDVYLRNFIDIQKEDGKISKGDACGYIAGKIREQNPLSGIPFRSLKSYAERRWNELLEEGMEGLEEETKLEEKQRRQEENWGAAKPVALEYFETLPKPPKLDKKRARKVVDDPSVLSQFKYFGRALENDFSEDGAEKRRIVRGMVKLEKAGLIRRKRYKTSINVANGKITLEYTIGYWEPYDGSPEKWGKEHEAENACIKDAKELEMSNLDVAEGFENTYLDSDLWDNVNGGRT